MRLVGLALATPLLVLAGFEAIHFDWGFYAGIDHALYSRGALRFLDTGTPYSAAQLAGPYELGGEIFLYPPFSLVLFVPFALAPAVLWWAIPAAIVAYCVYTWRPAPWSWPLLAFALAWPRTWGSVVAGNTDMWVVAFTAGGLLAGWPLALALVKPSVAPLLMFGVRRREMWLGLGGLAAVSLLFLPLWPQYLAAVRNLQADTLIYSLPNLPMLLSPVVAWAARGRPAAQETAALNGVAALPVLES